MNCLRYIGLKKKVSLTNSRYTEYFGVKIRNNTNNFIKKKAEADLIENRI